MTEAYLRITRPFPEPHLLVAPTGEILAINPAAKAALGLPSEPKGIRLGSLVEEAEERLNAFLTTCAGSGSLLPFSLTVRGGDPPVRYRCEGAALRPESVGDPVGVTLRLRPQTEATYRFLILNQKIEQLAKEIVERRRMEEELQAQALQLEETAAELEMAVDELEDQKERALQAQANAEQGAADLAAVVERLEVLAEAGELFSSSLDFRAALTNLASVCTASFADYCLTYLLEEDGSLHRVGASHADPERVELVDRLLHLMPLSLDVDQGAARVTRTGESALIERITDEMLVAAAQNEEHLAILRQLTPRSSIMVPLQARSRTIGAIAVGTVEGGRQPFGALDVTFIEEIARRAALAVDNLRLLHTAQEANRAKADFLAVMSHELRTPLNAIVGYVDLLDAEVRGPVTEGQREQLRRIERSAKHLISIIAEILEYARLEAGKEIVHLEEFDLRDLAREAAEAIEAVAVPRGLAFRLDLPPAAVVARTDPAKVRQILLNLLSNAVKFTDAGEVGLGLIADGATATFRIDDTGPGIATEDILKIFDPFWQVQRGPTRKSDGTGLGLTVSRRLVHLLGGDITIETTPGQGSSFFFSLPLSVAEQGEDSGPVLVRGADGAPRG